MRRALFLFLCGLGAFLLLAASAGAGGKSVADYPLRVHIFHHTAHSHYWHRNLEQVDGEGRANLYENGQPEGFDFGYRCGDRMLDSMGYETYYARWKKPGQVLQVLLPVMGKPGAAEACDLDVIFKNAAYYYHNGKVTEEPQAANKAWMDRHQYDPEHDMNIPVNPEPAAAPPPAQ